MENIVFVAEMLINKVHKGHIGLYSSAEKAKKATEEYINRHVDTFGKSKEIEGAISAFIVDCVVTDYYSVYFLSGENYTWYDFKCEENPLDE